MAAQHLPHPVGVELPFPARDHHRRHTIAQQVHRHSHRVHDPIAATVADNARNDEPGTPAMPFDVSISTRTAVTCSPRLRSTPRACARNSTQIDRYSVAPSRLNE